MQTTIQLVYNKPCPGPNPQVRIIGFWATISVDGTIHENGGEAGMIAGDPSGLRPVSHDPRQWISPNFRAWLTHIGYANLPLVADMVEMRAVGA